MQILDTYGIGIACLAAYGLIRVLRAPRIPQTDLQTVFILSWLPTLLGLAGALVAHERSLRECALQAAVQPTAESLARTMPAMGFEKLLLGCVAMAVIFLVAWSRSSRTRCEPSDHPCAAASVAPSLSIRQAIRHSWLLLAGGVMTLLVLAKAKAIPSDLSGLTPVGPLLWQAPFVFLLSTLVCIAGWALARGRCTKSLTRILCLITPTPLLLSLVVVKFRTVMLAQGFASGSIIARDYCLRYAEVVGSAVWPLYTGVLALALLFECWGRNARAERGQPAHPNIPAD